MTPTPKESLPVGAGSKRKSPDTIDEPMPRKKTECWSVQDVLAYLQHLGLGHVGPAFEENGIDGQMLVGLTELELVGSLGLKHLQAKKVVQRLQA